MHAQCVSHSTIELRHESHCQNVDRARITAGAARVAICRGVRASTTTTELALPRQASLPCGETRIRPIRMRDFLYGEFFYGARTEQDQE